MTSPGFFSNFVASIVVVVAVAASANSIPVVRDFAEDALAFFQLPLNQRLFPAHPAVLPREDFCPVDLLLQLLLPRKDKAQAEGGSTHQTDQPGGLEKDGEGSIRTG